MSVLERFQGCRHGFTDKRACWDCQGAQLTTLEIRRRQNRHDDAFEADCRVIECGERHGWNAA